MSKNIGLLPSCWGNAFWHTLHSIAYVYNPQTDKEKYYDFFSNLGYILPCEECKLHYSQNLNKQELSIALETNENLFKWVYDLHNKVNRQIGIPESKWPSYQFIKERYGSFKASCTDIPGVCGSGPGPGPQKKMKMVEQFGEFNEDQLPFFISTIILGILLAAALIYIGWLIKRK
jgi:hypothetical protein